MNKSPLEHGNTQLWKTLLKGREDLSWAGASAGDHGFCFGTEDGAVLWTNFDGVQYGDPLPNATLDNYDEAINGIAFNAGHMVATSRSGSAIWKNAEGKASKRKAVRIGIGSHGVVAGHDGAFNMALNVGGLMSVHESSPSHISTFTSASDAMDLNVYRTVSLTSTAGRQVVALAARFGGVAMGLYKPGDMLNLTALELPDADFIDICSTGKSNFPLAAYAITRDSHILAFQDVMTDRKPNVVHYEGIPGVAYRILAAGDFVFVLTSKALHVIYKLVECSLGYFKVIRRTPSTSFVLEAIDISLVGNKWLLVLLADGVLRLDLHELAKDLASDFEDKVSSPTDVWANPVVKVRQLDSHKSDFALVK